MRGSTTKKVFFVAFLTKEWDGREVVAHCGEGHEAPPEGVVEGPFLLVRSISLNGEDQT